MSEFGQSGKYMLTLSSSQFDPHQTLGLITLFELAHPMAARFRLATRA